MLEQAEEGSFNRSMLSSSFNERHNSTSKPNLERTFSFRERTLSNKSNGSVDSFVGNSRKCKNSLEIDMDDLSPPSSPKVKGVVEKSDSVSYVLDLDESPEVVASRIVRRSFRNSTPPKSTPTKSPSNKRPRMKNNPLSLSASASAIMSPKNECTRSRSVSVRNGDFDTGNSDDMYVWMMPTSSTPRSGKCIENYETTRSGKCSESYYESARSKLEEHLDLYEEEDVDIDIPALPSEIGRKNSVEALVVPRRLAESMISESNSDDESTSSSSVQL